MAVPDSFLIEPRDLLLATRCLYFFDSSGIPGMCLG